jgi:hypothetical protein
VSHTAFSGSSTDRLAAITVAPWKNFLGFRDVRMRRQQPTDFLERVDCDLTPFGIDERGMAIIVEPRIGHHREGGCLASPRQVLISPPSARAADGVYSPRAVRRRRDILIYASVQLVVHFGLEPENAQRMYAFEY